MVGKVRSSNKKYDKEKLLKYQNEQFIQEILMIEQKKMELTLYQKDSHGNYSSLIYRAGDVVHLKSIGCMVSIKGIYTEVLFN